MTKTYLTVNGQPLGFLSPRDEEIFVAGKIAALAYLREKVEAMSSAGGSNIIKRSDVLAAIDGSV